MSKFNVCEKDFLWIILALFENFETKRTQNRTKKCKTYFTNVSQSFVFIHLPSHLFIFAKSFYPNLHSS